MRASSFEQPYPLLRRFLRYIVPGLLALLAITAILTAVGARWLAEAVYLEQATRRAQVIDRAMAEAVPAHWERLKRGEAPSSLYQGDGGALLLNELTREVRELDLVQLKIYAPTGVIQYSTTAEEIGTIDRSSAFVAAAERNVSTVVPKTRADGSALYELYVLVRAPDGNSVVFELYEPVNYLNALLLRVGTAAAGVPSIILIVLMLGMARLVVRAQRDIDGRARLVGELRGRLEKLMSGAASRAVYRSVSAGGSIQSARTRCVILYCDVRDFTSFAEANEPEQVVRFLNRIMKILMDSIAARDGDVDKLIGDAVLALFQGPDAEARAIAAARHALLTIERSGLPRGAGFGIHRGDVILGTVGTSDRMDFTVIGDAVNVAARLCAAAVRGEIVADTDTIATAGDTQFGIVESVAVKGRREKLHVRRWNVSRDPAPCAAAASTGAPVA